MDAIYAKSLPSRPNLEQYRKQAKDLLKACRAGDLDAVRRINHQRPRASETEPELTASDCTLAEVQFALAREHGFESWPKFSHHLQGLAGGTVRQYESAVDAIVGGDVAHLESLLDSDPGLVRARSTRVHGATLLHYVAANGVESYRQKTPSNAADVADLLLRRGAAADATALMYSGPATTMGLLVSSVHPAEAGVQVALVHQLLDFGAAVDGPDGDGGPLLTAVMFSYSAAADALVQRGARVDNIVAAAGIGREDLVRAFVDDTGSLRPNVRVVSVPTPRSAPDARLNLGWALVCAAVHGHTGIVEFLVQHGVDVGARGFAGLTALHWAAIHAHTDIVDLLVENRAPLEDTENHHHATVLGCAVWSAGRSPSGDFVPVIERLLTAGARVDGVEFPTGNEAVDDLLRRSGARAAGRSAGQPGGLPG
ncbi:MAG: ankyrin repeat domain-containing protein [Actinopolymorphaceae bacterium]